MTTPVRLTGTVRITGTSLDRGFFFIRADSGVDFFGHVSELQAPLDELTVRNDDVVTFTPVHIQKGWKALDIRLADMDAS
jgi:cold shock CspA family protein